MAALIGCLLTATLMAPASTGAATVAPCQTSDLAANVAITSGGSQPSSPESSVIFLTNMSSTSCSLVGYPGVSAWNGHQVGNPATWVAAPQPFITLSPYATADNTASAQLNNLGTGRYSPKRCKAVPVNTLRVFVPNAQGPAKYIGFIFYTCASKDVTNLRVHPFQGYDFAGGYQESDRLLKRIPSI
jgi:hypothetical protein